jgi:hypothetical protein
MNALITKNRKKKLKNCLILFSIKLFLNNQTLTQTTRKNLSLALMTIIQQIKMI